MKTDYRALIKSLMETFLPNFDLDVEHDLGNKLYFVVLRDKDDKILNFVASSYKELFHKLQFFSICFHWKNN